MSRVERQEFWTYGIKVMGMLIYFVFALTPDVPDELYQKEVRPGLPL